MLKDYEIMPCEWENCFRVYEKDFSKYHGEFYSVMEVAHKINALDKVKREKKEVCCEK